MLDLSIFEWFYPKYHHHIPIPPPIPPPNIIGWAIIRDTPLPTRLHNVLNVRLARAIKTRPSPTTPDADLTHAPTRCIPGPIRTPPRTTNQSPPDDQLNQSEPPPTYPPGWWLDQAEPSTCDQSERSHPRVHRIAQPHLSKTVYRLTPKNAPPSRKTCYPHEKHATLTNNARKFEGIERCFPTKCFPSPHSVTSQKKEKRKKKRRNKRKKKERKRKKEGKKEKKKEKGKTEKKE